MRLFGRHCGHVGRHSRIDEDESFDSRSTETDGNDNVGSIENAFGVQWSGSESTGAKDSSGSGSDDDE